MNDISTVKQKIIPPLKQAGVAHSAIFGSVAKGEQTDKSDLDLLVEFEEGKSLFDLAALKIELENLLDMEVDLVTYDSLSPLLKKDILSRQVTLF
ncbi:MAG: nucleotidyltransferase family protein [Parcubacteria group bacterium]